jgi:hypothetical protein
MRVSFPVRQMLRLMSDSISRNVERLSYAQQLLTRKMVCHTTGRRVTSLTPPSFDHSLIQSRVAGTNNHRVISSRTRTTCSSYSMPILACL